MKKKDSTGLGMTIPRRMRLAGMTFYLRNGQLVGRASSTHEKRSNTLPQFIQRQKMRHTTALWKMLRFCDVMFTERRTAYQNFASLANQLPAVFVTKTLMEHSSFLMPGIPMSDGILPTGRLVRGPRVPADRPQGRRTVRACKVATLYGRADSFPLATMIASANVRNSKIIINPKAKSTSFGILLVYLCHKFTN